MSVLTIILMIIVVGILLYVANQFPIEPRIKTILNWVVIGLLVVWLMKALGLWSYLSRMTVP